MNALWRWCLEFLFDPEDLGRLESVRFDWGADWVDSHPALIWLALLAALLAAFWFYRRGQSVGRSAGVILATLRGMTLISLVVIFADPILELRSARDQKPLLWLLVDSSESMQLPATGDSSPAAPTRAEHWNRQLANDSKLRKLLSERFRAEAYSFADVDSLQPFDWTTPSAGRTSPTESTRTGATAIGAALEELQRRGGTRDPAGVILVSDFVQNRGPAAIESAASLDRPIFAVGLGQEAAVDLAVELDAESVVMKDERTTVAAILRQSGLVGKSVTLRLTGRSAADATAERLLGERRIVLENEQSRVEFPLTPETAGRLTLQIEADILDEETLPENNRDAIDVSVTDHFIRVLFVEYEPTWEWRFIKEVFHRDRLVGRGGFRTYLRSSDRAVREANELFIPTLPPSRAEFFKYDVIFIGDVPASALPGRFCEMTREFVSEFGGGLVVLAGPRFGPQALAGTPIADMLPVIIDPQARRRDEPFQLVLTNAAQRFDFMQLGQSPKEHERAWSNLGELPWYQPVQRVESTSVVLAEHPTDTTADGRTKQPLVARRQYGAAGGEVVYLGFNETWRLRRLYGEKYYRQFWGQLIHRLGLGHAQGGDKRFVIDPLPEEPFAPGEEIPLQVRVWNANFEPLTDEALPNGSLAGAMIRQGPGVEQELPVSLAMTRPGLFEASVPVEQTGDWRFRVVDPITNQSREIPFQVADPSLERRVPNRDAVLQQQLAALRPAGRVCVPENLAARLAEFTPPDRVETDISRFPLVPTWPVFVLVVGLLLAEWSLRKWWHLA